jgi:hypothetical protein
MAPLRLQLILFAVMTLAAGIVIPSHNDTIQARDTGASKAVIVQMFEWTWDSVAAECTNFLGPAGYGYVQGAHFSTLSRVKSQWLSHLVSPPQEHITGSQWWTDYQPVSYTLTSKRGNRNQFANMINTCHSAGVKIIAGEF